MDTDIVHDEIIKLLNLMNGQENTYSQKRTKVSNILKEKFSFVTKSEGKYVIPKDVEEEMLAFKSKEWSS